MRWLVLVGHANSRMGAESLHCAAVALLATYGQYCAPARSACAPPAHAVTVGVGHLTTARLLVFGFSSRAGRNVVG